MKNAAAILLVLQSITSPFAFSSTDTSPREIRQNLAGYIGRRVTMEGKVIRQGKDGESIVINHGVMEDPMIVIAPREKTDTNTALRTLSIGEEITLEGTVDFISADEVSQFYDAQIDPSLRAEWTSPEPVLIVDMNSIRINQVKP